MANLNLDVTSNLTFWFPEEQIVAIKEMSKHHLLLHRQFKSMVKTMETNNRVAAKMQKKDERERFRFDAQIKAAKDE